MVSTSNTPDEEDLSKMSDLSPMEKGDDATVSTSPESTNAPPEADACLRASRLSVIVALIVFGVLAAIGTYFFTEWHTEDHFESMVDIHASEIAEASRWRFEKIENSAKALAFTVAQFAQSTSTSWPFETIPSFEKLATTHRDTSGSDLIAILPLVPHDMKSSWESYSVLEQGWIKEGYEVAGSSIEPLQIQPFIYNHEDGHATEATTGPFLPLWQTSTPPKHTGVVNYNTLSNEQVASTFDAAQRFKVSALSSVLERDEILDFEKDNIESILLQPILEDPSDIQSPLVGSIITTISWQQFFTDMVDDKNRGMYCVVRNSCGDSMTWMLNGPVANFEGFGDLHDTKYDSFETNVDITAKVPDDSSDYCAYTLSIYPSEDLEQEKEQPIIFTILMVLVFGFSGIAFFFYDRGVQKRQLEAISEAARSNAIVSSLFPAEVRERLFKGEDVPNAKKITEMSEQKAAVMPEAQTSRLKTYLDDEDKASPSDEGTKGESQDKQVSKPIADLFPNTTVMFADIAGFTAWSSVREPSQVFTLLETVYKAFDKIAKRRKVFKVETVGDCYVAVTGLPEPVKDHAIVMCKFAKECFSEFNTLVSKLEVILGPDTGDLDVRVGLHSGPVTAGVLRGDKSRFQLFGDTVNTAARIESTGFRGRIHVSHETAELLYQAGKTSWLRKRTETVMAKGKGEMQTYWLLTNEEVATGVVGDEAPKAGAPLPIVRANAPRIANAAENVLDPESTLPPRIKRLVDWNVDVLKKLLQQIVAKRNAMGKEAYDPNHPVMMKTEVNIGCDTYVLDEVTEIIQLPKYAHVEMQNPNKVELPAEVVSQLRLYVSSIAAMHRDNSFHNFEHASGVSNFQLIKEDAKIATVFKNKSVAEQNSIVLAWDRLMESRFVALRSFIYSDPDDLKRFRQLMVNTVLATDIFDKELQTFRKNRWDRAFRHISQQEDSSPEDAVNRKATIVLEHLIQASDVAHTMQHWHIYQKWNERLFAEMTVAFKAGRMGKNPADGWYQGELGFFDNYIIPLANKLKECGVFGVSSDEYLNYALENRREWATKGEEAVERMIQKYQTENVEEE